MGLKHILAVHKKARRLNLDANQWDVVSQLLPTLYDRPDQHRSAGETICGARENLY